MAAALLLVVATSMALLALVLEALQCSDSGGSLVSGLGGGRACSVYGRSDGCCAGRGSGTPKGRGQTGGCTGHHSGVIDFAIGSCSPGGRDLGHCPGGVPCPMGCSIAPNGDLYLYGGGSL